MSELFHPTHDGMMTQDEEMKSSLAISAGRATFYYEYDSDWAYTLPRTINAMNAFLHRIDVYKIRTF